MKGAVIPVSKELLASLLKLPEGVTVEVVRHSRRSRDIVSVYVEGDCLPDECAAYPPNVTRIVVPQYADNGRETTFERFDLGGIDIGGFDESPVKTTAQKGTCRHDCSTNPA